MTVIYIGAQTISQGAALPGTAGIVTTQTLGPLGTVDITHGPWIWTDYYTIPDPPPEKRIYVFQYVPTELSFDFAPETIKFGMIGLDLVIQIEKDDIDFDLRVTRGWSLLGWPIEDIFGNTVYTPFEFVSFADGTQWDAANRVLIGGTAAIEFQGSAQADFLQGGTGADRLLGAGSDDTVVGGAGADSLYGQGGDDTYLFDRAHLDGSTDVINGGSHSLVDGTDGIDRIVINDVDPTRVRMYSSYSAQSTNFINVVIDDADAQGTIRIPYGPLGYDYNPTEIVERIEIHFNGGTTVWDLTDGLEYVDVDGEVAHRMDGSSLGDFFRGLGGNDTLYGYNGDDTLDGGEGNDSLVGGNGDDTYFFASGDGNDLIREGADSTGNALQFAAGIGASDVLFRRTYGSSDLVIHAGPDTIEIANYFASGVVGTTLDQAFGTVHFGGGTTIDISSVVPTLTGTAAHERIAGTALADHLVGLEGNDSLYGDNRHDTLEGGLGNDWLYGGLGDDTYVVLIDGGVDIIIEESASIANTLQFGPGISAGDVLFRREYNSSRLHIETGYGIVKLESYFSNTNWSADIGRPFGTIRFNDGTTIDISSSVPTLTGTAAAERLDGTTLADHLVGLEGNDTLTGGSGNDLIFGGDAGSDTGNDMFYGGQHDDTLFSLGGADTLNGGEGADVAHIDRQSASAGMTITIAGAAGAEMLATSDGTTGTGIEAYIIVGSDFADTITAAGMADDISGRGGNYAIVGGAGDDRLSGGAGKDTLDGGSGIDTMIGGVGDDHYLADTSLDRVIEDPGSGIDAVVSTASTYRLSSNVENLILAGTATDSLAGRGNGEANTITGDEGNNILKGRGGEDTLNGGDGDDRISGNTAADSIVGGDGVDTLLGDSGKDSIDGGAGADIINGGNGDDVLIGGADADIFRFTDDYGCDTIADFEDGLDEINLRDIREENGDNALVFGQLLVTQAGSAARIELDLDMDGVADDIDLDEDGQPDVNRIDVSNTLVADLSASDFIF